MRSTTTGRHRMRTTSKTERILAVVLVILLSACADGDSDETPRDWLAYCQIEDGQCPEGCESVISKNSWSPDRMCFKDGVLLGCVPGLDSGYWMNIVHPEVEQICGRLVADPQYYVCYEGTRVTTWLLDRLEIFCIDTPCPEQTLECEPPSEAQ